MAVTTRNRRFSIIGLTSPTIPALPNPDGTLDIDDRPQLLKLYAGFSLTGGSAFNYEYTLTIGDHVFYNKSHRKALVIPNYVTVSLPGSYTGSAQHPDSAILEMRYYKELAVTSNAQAQSIADAILSHAIMDAEKGAATVPMNVGQEIYDYIKITDSREGDFRIGNVGYIKRHYKGGTFDMEIRLGSAMFSGTLSMGLGSTLTGSSGYSLAQVMWLLEQLYNQVQSILDYLEWLETQTTGAVAITTPTRLLNTVYQNSGKIRVVTVSCRAQITGDLAGELEGKSLWYVAIGASSPPTTELGYMGFHHLHIASDAKAAETHNATIYDTVSFVVPKKYYYAVYTSIADDGLIPVKNNWTEFDLV